MTAIFKREFRSLFQNVTGWIFVGAMTAAYGLYFVLYQLMSGYGSIAYSLNAITFFVIVLVPILTMRSFSEERKSKTDQLVMTAPVSTIKIVLGKYLALAATFTICIVLMGLSPLLLSFFGDVPFLKCYVALLGFYLYGLAMLAIGMFASSLTENQLISAVLSFALLILGFIMSNLTAMISQSGNWLTKVLNCYDTYTPLNDFMGGNLNLVHVFYYLSIIAICIFVTYEGIQKRRWSISARKVTFSVFSGVTFVLGLVVIVLLNVGVRAIPSTYTVLDVTEQKIYSLTDTSKKYLKTLDQDVTIYYYSTKAAGDDKVVKLLTNYKSASKHIKVKYIDPDSHPDFGQTYGEDSFSQHSVMVVGPNDSHKAIAYNDLYDLEVDYSTYQYVEKGFDAEGKITSAIAYVTSENRPTIYTLSGHNEDTVSSAFTEAISKANIDVENLNFMAADGVPEDAQAVVVLAPQMDFTEDDVTKLCAYLKQGGTLIATVNYSKIDDMPNFKGILETYGVTVKSGVVAEGDSDYWYNSMFNLLPVVSGDEVNGSLSGRYNIFAPAATAFGYEEKDGYTYTQLMTTSDDAFLISLDTIKAKVSQMSGNETEEPFTKEDASENGPFTIGLNVTAEDHSSIYLYGSSEMFTDAANSMVSGKNAMLFAQLLTTVCNTDDTTSVVVPVKTYDTPSLTVTQYAIRMYTWLWCVIIPLGAVLLGIGIWIVRKRR